MNIPQTMVALMAVAAEYDEVTEEMAGRVKDLLEGATLLEVTVLVASLANVNNYALTLLEDKTGMSKRAFLTDLGWTVARQESGEEGLPDTE